MDEFDSLRADLAGVTNISALARASNLSRKHIQRIRDGQVSNTTLKTVQAIRRGLREMESATAPTATPGAPQCP